MAALRAIAAEFAIIYHFPCVDGIFSAAAAAAALCPSLVSVTPTTAATTATQEIDTGPVRFLPLPVWATEEDLQRVISSSESLKVFMLDYSGPPGFLARLGRAAQSVVVLDHHKTGVEQVAAAQQDNSLPSNVEPIFDMNRSGAMMALDYFQEKHALVVSEDVKELYRYVQDHDLWRHELPGSQAFQKGLSSHKLSFDAINNPAIVSQLFALRAPELIAVGETLLTDDDRIIDADMDTAYVVRLPGMEGATCLAVQTLNSNLRSELGHRLGEESKACGMTDVGVVAYFEGKMEEAGEIKVSLRSCGETDTTKVTQLLGGGGHHNASSCIISKADFDKWKLAQ